MAELERPGFWRRATDVLGAVAAALLAFTAVPAVLVIVVGDPFRGGLGHSWPPLTHDALCVLTVAAWVAWLACCAQLLRVVVTSVRRGEVGARSGGSLVDWMAARIAIGVLALTSVGAPLALASGAGAVQPALHAATTGLPRGIGLPELELAARPTPATTHTVRRGESLWEVADAVLGDGAAWTVIAARTVGYPVGDFERLVDPDHIRPGWQLRLPTEGAPTSEGPHRALRARSAHPSRAASSSELPDHLPELVALGLGSLACAALARRSRRRFRRPPFVDPLGPLPLSERAVDTATLLQRFDGVPALGAFEAANRLLGQGMVERDGPGPGVRAIVVGPSGVTFHLAQCDLEVPDGFVATTDGTQWHVGHPALDSCSGNAEPFVPVVVPVGDDEAGTWLVALGPGVVLPVLGEGADDLVRAARTTVESWAWSDTLIVTEDGDDPRLRHHAVTDHCLFLGAPTALAPEVAARTAVLTNAAATASDLTVLVDRHGATLHPLGRVLRPHLLSAERAEDVAAICAPIVDDVARDPRDLSTAGPELLAGPSALFPGPVEVRLLTMTPRLDGLREPLPPNRVRRSVELVAYLALHAPDLITSDRLRNRVLGSTDADAASKTLFNVAHAARRALGADADGSPLFPAATRSGLYQLSPAVTVDVQRAVALVKEARAQDRADLAIAHYRAALDLVEGEPLANALAGFAWWETEGHGGRLAAVLVDAACTMAALAAELGHFELARWGLEQARRVEPYSEALSRAAMEVAAAEGDAEMLRAEWRQCQRRVDALDPGSSPSPRTEELFGELSRRVMAASGGPTGGRAAYTASGGPRRSDS